MTPDLEELFLIADALLVSGDVEGAKGKIAEAIRAAPGSPEPYYHRAELLSRLGGTENLKQAWMNLVRAITLGMQTPEVHLSLMRTLIALGEWDAAQAAYVEAVALAPGDAHVREWGVRLSMKRGNLTQALQLARRELDTQPGNLHWMRWVADLLMQSEAYQEAFDAFDALLEKHTPPAPTPVTMETAQWGEIFLKRAEASLRLGNLEEACADLDRAELYVPGEPGLAFVHGLIAWTSGDDDSAFPLLYSALTSAAPELRSGFITELADYPRLDSLLDALEETSSDD